MGIINIDQTIRTEVPDMRKFKVPYSPEFRRQIAGTNA